ncbi:MAG: diguanylate cyclase [Bdellovibrionales bacterium]|nr:diguanylate cyclase [Bdellovibrionales bacterium]
MNKDLPRILLVDDEAENLKALERTLREHFDVVVMSDPLEALKVVGKGNFEVVVSDQRMPKMTGTELLAKVAKLSPLSTRIILTAFTEVKEILDAINRAEIYRFVTKPWDNNDLIATLKQASVTHRLRKENKELVEKLEEQNRTLITKERELKTLNLELEKKVEERTQELRTANARLSELAMTDPLTKVLNRRAFFEKFDHEIERSRRYTHPICVAMIDVDHFKLFNDMEGHPLGDEALKRVANILKANIRKIDVLCRYGGEEFCLVMPETDVSVGLEICERLRNAIETTVFQGAEQKAYLTISIGISGFPEDGQSRADLIQMADQALYAAKKAGRNRVVSGQHNASFFVS